MKCKKTFLFYYVVAILENQERDLNTVFLHRVLERAKPMVILSGYRECAALAPAFYYFH